MRPFVPSHDDDAVALLRAHLPEFEDHYEDLLEIYDDDLSASIVFMELADFVADLLVGRDREPLLERCLDAVEEVAQASAPGRSLIIEAFFTELPSLTVERLRPLLGPTCTDLLVRLELVGSPGWPDSRDTLNL